MIELILVAQMAAHEVRVRYPSLFQYEQACRARGDDLLKLATAKGVRVLAYCQPAATRKT
jgi:hypothetical protein